MINHNLRMENTFGTRCRNLPFWGSKISTHGICHHLLVGGWAYPSEKWWSSSIGMMIFPTEWKVIKFMFQTTNQSTTILEPDLPYFSASFWGTKDVCQKSSPYENPRNWAKFSVSQQRSPRVLQPSGHLGKEPGKVHSLLWKMDENGPWRYDFPTEKWCLWNSMAMFWYQRVFHQAIWLSKPWCNLRLSRRDSRTFAQNTGMLGLDPVPVCWDDLRRENTIGLNWFQWFLLQPNLYLSW